MAAAVAGATDPVDSGNGRVRGGHGRIHGLLAGKAAISGARVLRGARSVPCERTKLVSTMLPWDGKARRLCINRNNAEHYEHIQDKGADRRGDGPVRPAHAGCADSTRLVGRRSCEQGWYPSQHAYCAGIGEVRCFGGVCFTVLWVLGLDDALDEIADLDQDWHGKALQALRRPKRPRNPRQAGDSYGFGTRPMSIPRSQGYWRPCL